MKKYFASATLTAWMLAGLTSPAAAQTAPLAPPAATGASGVTTIQEVVITAEHREQSVQKAALTIQVVDAAEVARTGLASAQDLTRITPSVQIGTGSNTSQIFVRGVGDFSYSSLASPGVAFNVDGVYVGRPDGVNGNFYDIQRVEVLKGPQGTLYGRNANGGAINLITNSPRLGEFGGYISGELGNYSDKSVNGAVNLPIGDTVAIRGAFNIINRNGYLSDGTSDDKEQAGRIRIKAQPSDAVSILLNADVSHLGGHGGGYVYLPLRPGASPWEGTASPQANAYRPTFGGAAPLIPAFSPSQAQQDTTLSNVSAQLDWKLGFATLTVLPAYRDANIKSSNNPGFFYTSRVHAKQKSLEVRLGDSTPKLTWVLGAYVFDEDISGNNIVDNGNFLQNIQPTYRPRTKAYAGFGQATYEVLSGLRLIGGIRYTYEDRSLAGDFLDRSSGVPTVLFPFGGKKTFSAVTWKAGWEYDLAPQNLLYFTASTGYKAGGFNQTIGTSPLATYQPERLTSYELGSRNRFLDNRLQVNLGAFLWKYKNIQDQRVGLDPATGSPNFLFANSGDATLYGITADVIARPTEADTISASLEYTHSRYDRFNVSSIYAPGSVGCPLLSLDSSSPPFTIAHFSCAGFQVARVPEWSGSVSYAHMFVLRDGSRVRLGADVKFSSAHWIGTDFLAADRDGAYAIGNANLDFLPAGKNIRVGLFVRNIANQASYTGALQEPFVPGLLSANISPPRTFGVQLRYGFGGE
jgi:iron complex outermembrane receptor protein